MLIKLIYASRAVSAMSDADLTEVLTVARRRNRAGSVTGMLLYCRESFLQMLEGEPASVDAIYSSISQDGRHDHLRLLERAPTATRRFPDWSMGFEMAGDDDLARVLPGFLPATEYPLIAGDLVRNATVAETLLGLYRRNG